MEGNDTHLGHDGLPVFSSHIAERHLGALVLVELELWMIEVGDLVQGGYPKSARIS